MITRERSCDNKKQYESEQAALDNIKRHQAVQMRQRGRKGCRSRDKKLILNAYWCRFCGYFHLGHTRPQINVDDNGVSL